MDARSPDWLSSDASILPLPPSVKAMTAGTLCAIQFCMIHLWCFIVLDMFGLYNVWCQTRREYGRIGRGLTSPVSTSLDETFRKDVRDRHPQVNG
jgi:hypothetical protein